MVRRWQWFIRKEKLILAKCVLAVGGICPFNMQDQREKVTNLTYSV